MFTLVAVTTTNIYYDYERDTVEFPGDDTTYHNTIEATKANGFSVWSTSSGDTFWQTELRDEDGTIVRITLMTDGRSCYESGIGTLRAALDANEEGPMESEAENTDQPRARYLVQGATHGDVYVTDDTAATDVLYYDEWQDAPGILRSDLDLFAFHLDYARADNWDAYAPGVVIIPEPIRILASQLPGQPINVY